MAAIDDIKNYESKKTKGIYGNIYKDHALLMVDGTAKKIGDYDSDFMFLIVADTVISATFNYMYNSNGATTVAVTKSNVTETITGWDITANGYIISRRRYGDPGVAKNKAYSDAREVLAQIYKGLLDVLNVDTEDKDHTFTTLSTYPVHKETAKLSELKGRIFESSRSDLNNLR